MTRDDLTDQLAELPDEATVPAHLDARVLARASAGAARPPWPGLALSALGGGLATAALAALLFSAVPTPGDYRLIEGVETVRGDGVMLLAGDVKVRVDGEARITVEPTADLARTPDPEVNMGTSHWLSAAGGAAVTVAVVAGAALVWPDGDGQPLRITAGDSWTSEEAGGPDGPMPLAIRVSPDSPQAAAILAGDLEGATQSALAEEVKRLRMETQLLRGQLEKYQGPAEPWPEQVAADLKPEAFEATLDGVLENHPDAEVVRIDCDEYPCLAVVRARPGTTDPTNTLKGFAEAMGEAVKKNSGADEDDEIDRGVMMAIAQRDNGEGEPESVGIVGLIDGSRGQDPDRQARMHQRMQELEQDETP